MDPNNNRQSPAGQPPGPAAAAPYIPPPGPELPAGYGAYGPQPAVAAGAGYTPNPTGLPMAPGQTPDQSGSRATTTQATKSNPNSTQNTLQVAEIRDGIVIMNDGSFRSVVMAKSINFDLMSSDERNGVEYAYQGFLNSLYFPIQIFLRSQKVDIRPYLERLDKIRQEHDNMLLALLMEDYLEYIDALASQTNIMDKKFYVIIPYFPAADAQKALAQSKNFFSGLKSMFNSKEQHVVINEQELIAAKDELRNRVQAIMDGLRQCGIPSLPLDTQELIELFYDAYNPDTATRQQLKNFDDLSVPVVTKGEGQAPQPQLDKELQ